MRWYFSIKLLVTLLFVIFSYRFVIFEHIVVGAMFVDFTIIPIVYLVYNYFRKRKLAPGEYKVKPEGKRL